MKLSCPHCQHQFQVDDAKVPSGAFKIKCPKCAKLLTASRETAAAATASETPPETSPDEDQSGEEEISPAVQAYIKKELSAMKKELLAAMSSLFGGSGEAKWRDTSESGEDDLGPVSKRALICEDDQSYIDIITQAVKHLGYSFDIARSTGEAIKKVEGNFYDLITVDYVFPDDKEGGNKIIAKINGQKPAQRRQMFVVLISANVKSSDANAAFFHGANITVNKEEIRKLETLIREGQRNYQEIYSMFSRVMTEKNQKL